MHSTELFLCWTGSSYVLPSSGHGYPLRHLFAFGADGPSRDVTVASAAAWNRFCLDIGRDGGTKKYFRYGPFTRKSRISVTHYLSI